MTTRPTPRRRGLLALLALSGLSSGCISQTTLANLGSNMKPETVLMSPQVLGLISQGQRIGATLLGAMVVILALVCWYRAQQGMAFVGLIKEWFLGAGIALYLITTIGQGDLSAVLWIYKAGQFLGATFTPPQGYWAANHDVAVGKMAAFLEDSLKAPGQAAPPGSLEAAAFLEGVLGTLMNPVAVLGIVFNGIAIHLFKLVLQVSFTFLLVFYWTLTPLVAPMMVLPQTRHVFLGWVKSYISIALWPFFFAIVEQLSIAIPWSTWLGLDALGASIVGFSAWVQGQIMLLVLNIGFLAVYASIPVVSNRIVSGAAQPFRGGLL